MPRVLVMFRQKQIRLTLIIDGYFCKIQTMIYNLAFMNYFLSLEMPLVARKLQTIAHLVCQLFFLIQFQKILQLILFK